MKALLDTNILIDYLNGIDAARQEIGRYLTPTISVITWMEVMAGAKDDDEAVLRRFLQRFRCIAIDQPIAERTVQLRRTLHLKLPDAIIAASAQVNDVLLVTRNTKDFSSDEPWVRMPIRSDVAQMTSDGVDPTAS